MITTDTRLIIIYLTWYYRPIKLQQTFFTSRSCYYILHDTMSPFISYYVRLHVI